MNESEGVRETSPRDMLGRDRGITRSMYYPTDGSKPDGVVSLLAHDSKGQLRYQILVFEPRDEATIGRASVAIRSLLDAVDPPRRAD